MYMRLLSSGLGRSVQRADQWHGILAPQKFDNKEVGIKWNALPHLLF